MEMSLLIDGLGERFLWPAGCVTNQVLAPVQRRAQRKRLRAYSGPLGGHLCAETAVSEELSLFEEWIYLDPYSSRQMAPQDRKCFCCFCCLCLCCKQVLDPQGYREKNPDILVAKVKFNHYFLAVLEAWKTRSECHQGWLLVRLLIVAGRRPPPHRDINWPFLLVCARRERDPSLSSSSSKDASPIRLGPSPILSLNLLKGLISKSSHMRVRASVYERWTQFSQQQGGNKNWNGSPRFTQLGTQILLKEFLQQSKNRLALVPL